MQQRPSRPRRVQLAVPGSSPKMMRKASESRADHVFLDLEDAVAPSAKEDARSKVVEALNTLDWSGKTRCVRINAVSTKYAHRDIIAVVEGAGGNIDTILVPKVMSDKDVYFVDMLLSQLEETLGLTRKIGIEVLIEEVEGMLGVEAIAKASTRLEALIFGMGDYSASQGIKLAEIGKSGGYPGDIWHYARFKTIVAARAAGIDAIDGPFADFRDVEGYRTECRRAMLLGFDGKWAIHPSQIDPAMEIFSPSAEEVQAARAMVAAYEAAEAKGLGAVSIDGVMVDAASVRIVSNILKKADLFGI